MIKLNEFIETIATTNINLVDYINWDKINTNLLPHKEDCDNLSFFLSKSKIEFMDKFEKNYKRYKKSFKILPNLISRRELAFTYIINEHTISFNYKSKKSVLDFIRTTGLMENVFLNRNCQDIYTLCLGIEIGLSSNALKNKSGKWATEIFEKILLKHNIKQFEKEVPLSRFFNLDGEAFDNVKNKVLDYVFKYKNIIYLVEVNYFNRSGSKISGEATRLIKLNEFINKQINRSNSNKKYKFLYITDGVGWLNNKSYLTNVLEQIDDCYNFALFHKYFFSK